MTRSKDYNWLNSYVNASGREKVETCSNFYVEAFEHYARTTFVNSDLKTQRWKLDNVKSTQEFTHVKFYFYVRFQFLRTLTCVDKNATVEIHLYTSDITTLTQRHKKDDMSICLQCEHPDIMT